MHGPGRHGSDSSDSDDDEESADGETACHSPKGQSTETNVGFRVGDTDEIAREEYAEQERVAISYSFNIGEWSRRTVDDVEA